MTNKQKHIDIDLVEKYCLGLATAKEKKLLEAQCKRSPQLKALVEAHQQLLERYLHAFQRVAPAHNKTTILEGIEDAKLKAAQLNHSGQLSHFITLSPASNIAGWQQLIQSIQPATHYENIHIHPLFRSSEEQLYVLWVKKNIPEEAHPQLKEHFLILEGSCICVANGTKHQLQAGAFMEMPAEGTHYIDVTSEGPIKALLSRTKIA
ncbi:MAG: cupin domain-containing protein [Bacteroidota bacterium]